MAERAVSRRRQRASGRPRFASGVLSLSELRRRHKTAAKERRAREAEEAETTRRTRTRRRTSWSTRGCSNPRIFGGSERFAKRQADAAMEKVGAKKAKETAAEEMRRMLRLADRSNVADRRVNPDALMAVGLRKAHDGDEGGVRDGGARRPRGVWRQSGEEEQKVERHHNVEKKKRKNMPLAARVQAAGRRRRGSTSSAQRGYRDKQFKGKFRKGANN